MKKLKSFYLKLIERAVSGFKNIFASKDKEVQWAKKQIKEMARLGGRLVL